MVNSPRIQPHISAVPSTEEELPRMLAGMPVIALWSSICNERKKKRVVKTFPIKGFSFQMRMAPEEKAGTAHAKFSFVGSCFVDR